MRREDVTDEELAIIAERRMTTARRAAYERARNDAALIVRCYADGYRGSSATCTWERDDIIDTLVEIGGKILSLQP